MHLALSSEGTISAARTWRGFSRKARRLPKQKRFSPADETPPSQSHGSENPEPHRVSIWVLVEGGVCCNVLGFFSVLDVRYPVVLLWNFHVYRRVIQQLKVVEKKSPKNCCEKKKLIKNIQLIPMFEVIQLKHT